MAAAEYFSPGPLHNQSQQTLQPPTSHPQQMNPGSNHSSPQFRPQQNNLAPPPYSPFAEQLQQNQRPGVHFAPRPTEIPQRHSFSGAQRPSFAGDYTPPRPNYAHNAPHGSMAVAYNQQQGHYTPPQSQQLAPHMRPYTRPNPSTYSLDTGGYSSDPEPQRHRRKHHSRRDHSHDRSRDMKDRGHKSSSRSTNNDALLGAAAGGLIGDLIFPGLGTTLAGAGLGWLGGKDYGNHRKWREERREREQREWEEKFRPNDAHKRRDNHGRSRSRSGGSGGSGGDHREPPPFLDRKERKHSYDRKPSNH